MKIIRDCKKRPVWRYGAGGGWTGGGWLAASTSPGWGDGARRVLARGGAWRLGARGRRNLRGARSADRGALRAAFYPAGSHGGAALSRRRGDLIRFTDVRYCVGVLGDMLFVERQRHGVLSRVVRQQLEVHVPWEGYQV